MQLIFLHSPSFSQSKAEEEVEYFKFKASARSFSPSKREASAPSSQRKTPGRSSEKDVGAAALSRSEKALYGNRSYSKRRAGGRTREKRGERRSQPTATTSSQNLRAAVESVRHPLDPHSAERFSSPVTDPSSRKGKGKLSSFLDAEAASTQTDDPGRIPSERGFGAWMELHDKDRDTSSQLRTAALMQNHSNFVERGVSSLKAETETLRAKLLRLQQPLREEESEDQGQARRDGARSSSIFLQGTSISLREPSSSYVPMSDRATPSQEEAKVFLPSGTERPSTWAYDRRARSSFLDE